MKQRLQRLFAALMSVALVMTSITVYAAEATHHIEWYVKQNAEGQAANYPNNWPFAYEYFDVASKTFNTMEQDLGDNGWADTTTSAVIKPWEQVATDSKYAVTIYYARQQGTITLQNRQNFSGSGQIMLLQKNAEGKFAVLKDWTDAGTTWVDTKTYANANESIYFIYRAKEGSSVASFVPQLVHDQDGADTQNLYPTTWKTINSIMFPEPEVETKTSEISWFVTQSAEGQAANYPHNWPFTYEYYDAATGQFKTMEQDLGADGWADTTNGAIVTTWTQKATDTKYVAVVYYANQQGTAVVQNRNNATLNGYQEDSQIMLLQRKADGNFSVLQDWKDVNKNSTLAWTDTTTYLQQGEMIYFVYRSKSSTQAQVQNFTPQVTQSLGNEDTQSQYPTTWQSLASIMYEETASDISWFAKQSTQPYSGSNWTFEYFDIATDSFKQLETFVAEADPGYWTDTTGAVQVKGWEQLATNKKYAAIAFTADAKGILTLTNNTSVSANFADGQLMLVQKSNGKYHVLLDWTTIATGQSVTLPNVQTYVQAGDVVYYVYRSTSDTSSLLSTTPSVTYLKGAPDTANQYPTEWVDALPYRDAGKFLGMTLSLDGTIGFNFYVSKISTLSNEAYVTFTLPCGTNQTVAIGNAVETFDGLKFTCHIPAKEMTDVVVATLYDDGEIIDTKSVSVRDYTEVILKNEANLETYTAAQPLVKAMINYGAYSQKLFNYNVENLANDKYETDTEIQGVSYRDLAEYSKARQGLTGFGVLAGATLVLESETTLRMWFQFEQNADLSDLTFTVDGKEQSYVKSGDYYIVDFANIAAKDLDKDFTVTVSAGTRSFNASSSAMTYCYNSLINTSNAALHNVAKAMYLYNASANAYFK